MGLRLVVKGFEALVFGLVCGGKRRGWVIWRRSGRPFFEIGRHDDVGCEERRRKEVGGTKER